MEDRDSAGFHSNLRLHKDEIRVNSAIRCSSLVVGVLISDVSWCRIVEAKKTCRNSALHGERLPIIARDLVSADTWWAEMVNTVHIVARTCRPEKRKFIPCHGHEGVTLLHTHLKSHFTL